MHQFKNFLNKKINIEKLKDADKLNTFGVAVRYLPEFIEEFDEIEFGAELKNGQIIAFPITIEKFAISRMLFGKPKDENPEILLPLTEKEFQEFLEEKEKDIMDFFYYLTN